MKTILAVDQSYTSCGIVVLSEDRNMIFVEKFTTNKSDDMFLRAWHVAQRVLQIAKKFQVTQVVMEGLAFAKNGNATRDLAGLQYTIVTLLKFVEGYDIDIISPNTVKKTATGKGNSSKDEMVEKLPKNIRKTFDEIGVKKTTGLHDLSDAYWIGISHLNSSG